MIRTLLVRASLALCVLALVASCRVQGKRQAFKEIGAEAETLRAEFNAAAGHVRVIALVAPT